MPWLDLKSGECRTAQPRADSCGDTASLSRGAVSRGRELHSWAGAFVVRTSVSYYAYRSDLQDVLHVGNSFECLHHVLVGSGTDPLSPLPCSLTFALFSQCGFTD